jgi:Holliday junction resolvase RusA-like endonuclease
MVLPPIKHIATLNVTGVPMAQPRQRHRIVKPKSGKQFVHNYTPQDHESRSWKDLIMIEALKNKPKFPLTGPLQISWDMFFPRPKSHYVGGKRDNPIKENAPILYDKKPDRDNCDKAILDALTSVGIIHDDKTVCTGTIRQLYADGYPGAIITIEEYQV